MVYAIVADLMPPERIRRLDAARHPEIWTALTSTLLQEARRAEVQLDRVQIEVTQGGAILVLKLQAATLEVAEAVARLLVAATLRNHEQLADWRIASCGVRFDRLRLEEGFHVQAERDDGLE